MNVQSKMNQQKPQIVITPPVASTFDYKPMMAPLDPIQEQIDQKFADDFDPDNSEMDDE